MDNFSKRLKKLRHELNITQNDFAQSCEVKLTAISKYETGLVKPGFDMLYKIASVYNVNLNWLILGIGEMFLQTVALKNGTNESIVSVTHEITSNNRNFTIKSNEKPTERNVSNINDESDEDVISLIINLASKLSQNPQELEKLKALSKNFNL